MSPLHWTIDTLPSDYQEFNHMSFSTRTGCIFNIKAWLCVWPSLIPYEYFLYMFICHCAYKMCVGCNDDAIRLEKNTPKMYECHLLSTETLHLWHCIAGKSDKIWNGTIRILFFIFKIYLDLIIHVIIQFDRIKISLTIVWIGVMLETWSKISLEPSSVRGRKALWGLVPWWP